MLPEPSCFHAETGLLEQLDRAMVQHLRLLGLGCLGEVGPAAKLRVRVGIRQLGLRQDYDANVPFLAGGRYLDSLANSRSAP